MPARDHALLRQLPNALTLARLVIVPLFVVTFIVAGGARRNSDPAVLLPGLLFTAAAVTDFFDGFLARRLGVQSQFGKLVDPAADRLLVGSAAVLVSLYDARLPDWAFVVVVWRDVLTGIGSVVLRRSRRFDVSVSWLGKTSTAWMMGGLAGMMLFGHGHRWPVWLFWLGVICSVVAFVDYLHRYRAVFRAAPPAERSS